MIPRTQDLPSTPTLAALAREVVSCRRCPRLVAHREAIARGKRAAYRDWTYWGRPVPGFGDPRARVVLLGLAPGAHGANRTGRVFTGDASGRFLMRALYQAGFANQATSEHADDGLELRGLYVTAALKCVPPQDRPSGEELSNCALYLERELRALTEARVIITLGRVAFQSARRYAADVLGRRLRLAFRHGEAYELGGGLPSLLCCYHPSPRNTNTGRLRREELVELLRRARELAGLEACHTRR